ncbi:MAG TPA: DUF2950 domain-containing protein [Aliidongia sp.]|nr:DUF2950 domain-containing protein [Aliidongia sp.]
MVTKRRLLILGILMLSIWAPAARAADGEAPESFASPEQAVEALITAARADDATALLRIYGPAGEPLISSGDPVADKGARARFVQHYGEGSKIERDTAGKATLVIGPEEWPFPIPIMQQAGSWHFDVAAGTEEILDRRVGRNELNAIEVCRSYVEAQRDYAADLQGEGKPAEYAQKFVSSAGHHDGLYWPAGSGEKASPIGPQMASARAEGYGGAGDQPGRPEPYHGYFYKILTRQGVSAPGGARDYLDDGGMTRGFALLAFPAKYGDSGVKTFIIDQDGIVFEKDLGPDTSTVAPAITEFDPDLSWKTP